MKKTGDGGLVSANFRRLNLRRAGGGNRIGAKVKWWKSGLELNFEVTRQMKLKGERLQFEIEMPESIGKFLRSLLVPHFFFSSTDFIFALLCL